MSSPITISIVAPIYGVEKYIGRFADSVLGQTYEHVQFVFVNDGTRDSSMDILEGIIESRYSHLKERIVIVNKENGGLPAARKTGMEHATGDYVWHVDSDDWVETDAAERIAAEIDRTGSDVIYFDFVKEYKDRSKVKRERSYTSEMKDEYIRNMYNHKSFGCVWNKCVRRSVYDGNDVSFPQFSYAEDTFLMSQIIGYSGSISHLDAVLYHYRKDNPQAMTRQKIRSRREQYARNFINLYELYKDVPDEKNPVAVLSDFILMQVGWNSIVYGFDFFREFPYLADAVSRASIRRESQVWMIAQLITKSYAAFRR